MKSRATMSATPTRAPSRLHARTLAAWSAWIAACLALAGCFNNRLPKLDPSTPAHWRNQATAPARPPVDLHAWWKAFNDPMLNRLVDQALRDNPDVAIATERLRAARALYSTRKAPYRPQVGLHTSDPIDPDATSSYFVIGFDATWELPLFGRGQANDRMAGGRLGEAMASLREARVTLVAEVARDLVRLRTAQRQAQLLEDVARIRQRQLDLMRTRVRLQLADRADLARAQADLASSRAALAQPRMEADEAAQQLAVLLGLAEPRPKWLKPAPVPHLGATGPIAAPAELLRTRPGIAQAEARVVEAAGELGIARANLYPRIGLGASILWSTNITAYHQDPGTNAIGSVGPVIEMPLFDWGMRVSAKHARGHDLRAAVLAYRKAVLAGVADVETALGNLQRQREREAAGEDACHAWDQARDAQRTRRRLGLSSDLDDAEVGIARARAELDLAAARGDRDIAYVALYKALGGAPPLDDSDDSAASASGSIAMMVALARKTLIYEWRRFLPAVLAVGFAGLLQLLQAALVLGIFGGAAVYITGSSANLWVGYPGTQSVDQGRSISPDVATLLHMDPRVTRVEPFLWVDGDWRAGGTGGVSVFVSGIDPSPNGMMFARALPPSLRERLDTPDAVIVDRADLDKLGVAIGGSASINGHRVRVVGVASGLRALGGVNVVASLDTARLLDSDPGDVGRPTYLVARLRHPARAAEVAASLNGHSGFGPYEAWTARAFARRSMLFWLFDTGAGAGVLFLAGIVFLVGAVITSQALVAAVVGSIREYATLNALGVGVKALRRVVLEQALWVGAIGLVGAALLGSLLIVVAHDQDVPVVLNLPVTLTCVLLILALAVVSGLASMRSLRRADPATLLR